MLEDSGVPRKFGVSYKSEFFYEGFDRILQQRRPSDLRGKLTDLAQTLMISDFKKSHKEDAPSQTSSDQQPANQVPPIPQTLDAIMADGREVTIKDVSTGATLGDWANDRLRIVLRLDRIVSSSESTVSSAMFGGWMVQATKASESHVRFAGRDGAGNFWDRFWIDRATGDFKTIASFKPGTEMVVLGNVALSEQTRKPLGFIVWAYAELPTHGGLGRPH
jgi:hypothetical protein